MGTIIRFLHSPGVTLLIIVISSSFAKYGIIATPPIFFVSTVMKLGTTDFFFPVVGKLVLLVLLLMVKGLSDCRFLRLPQFSPILHFSHSYL